MITENINSKENNTIEQVNCDIYIGSKKIENAGIYSKDVHIGENILNFLLMIYGQTLPLSGKAYYFWQLVKFINIKSFKISTIDNVISSFSVELVDGKTARMDIDNETYCIYEPVVNIDDMCRYFDVEYTNSEGKLISERLALGDNIIPMVVTDEPNNNYVYLLRSEEVVKIILVKINDFITITTKLTDDEDFKCNIEKNYLEQKVNRFREMIGKTRIEIERTNRVVNLMLNDCSFAEHELAKICKK